MRQYAAGVRDATLRLVPPPPGLEEFASKDEIGVVLQDQVFQPSEVRVLPEDVTDEKGGNFEDYPLCSSAGDEVGKALVANIGEDVTDQKDLDTGELEKEERELVRALSCLKLKFYHEEVLCVLAHVMLMQTIDETELQTMLLYEEGKDYYSLVAELTRYLRKCVRRSDIIMEKESGEDERSSSDSEDG